MVVKEILQTIQVEIAPRGDSVGGLQYELSVPIKVLIREDYIVLK